MNSYGLEFLKKKFTGEVKKRKSVKWKERKPDTRRRALELKEKEMEDIETCGDID